jgi:hypothetical protein
MRTPQKLFLLGLLVSPHLAAVPAAAPEATAPGAVPYTVVFTSNRTNKLNPCG